MNEEGWRVERIREDKSCEEFDLLIKEIRAVRLGKYDCNIHDDTKVTMKKINDLYDLKEELNSLSTGDINLLNNRFKARESLLPLLKHTRSPNPDLFY